MSRLTTKPEALEIVNRRITANDADCNSGDPKIAEQARSNVELLSVIQFLLEMNAATGEAPGDPFDPAKSPIKSPTTGNLIYGVKNPVTGGYDFSEPDPKTGRPVFFNVDETGKASI